MATITRNTDAKGRVSLPKGFANATVIIEEISNCEVRIRKAAVIPEDEVIFEEERRKPLSDRDRDFLLAMLENPPPLNEKLWEAMAEYKKHYG